MPHIRISNPQPGGSEFISLPRAKRLVAKSRASWTGLNRNLIRLHVAEKEACVVRQTSAAELRNRLARISNASVDDRILHEQIIEWLGADIQNLNAEDAQVTTGKVQRQSRGKGGTSIRSRAFPSAMPIVARLQRTPDMPFGGTLRQVA